MRFHRIFVAVAALVAATGLAGCQGDESDSGGTPASVSASGTASGSVMVSPPTDPGEESAQPTQGAEPTTALAEPAGSGRPSDVPPARDTTGTATEPGEPSKPTKPAGDGLTRTQIRTISPVTASGALRPGWTSKTGEDTACDDSQPSPVAADDGIFVCGSSAASYEACWKVSETKAACVQSPYVRQVEYMRYDGGEVTTKAPASPSPWGVVLADGTLCQPRFGGGGSVRPDGYISRYYCSGGGDLVMPVDDGGAGWFGKDGQVWTAQLDDGKGPPDGSGPRQTVRIKAISFATNG